MYNLLIVDDEVTVVNGLAFGIDWNELGITDIYRAYSSRQAIEYLEKNRIDIVISDIRMPEMDGLELAARIREQWPYSKVILISGYDDFQYAQRAIDHKVIGYITKPADYDDVIDMVKRSINEINKDLEQVKALDDAKKKVDEITPLLRERYLNSWIVQGRVTLEEIKNHLILNNITIGHEDSGFLIMLRIDEFGSKDTYYSNGTYEIAVKNLTNEMLLKGRKIITFSDLEGNHIFMSHGSKDDVNLAFLYAKEMMGNLQNSIKMSLDCIVSAFWSDIVPVEILHQSYMQLYERSHRLLSTKSGVLMGPETSNTNSRFRKLSSLSKSPTFELLIETLQLEKSLKRIDCIFEELDKESVISDGNLLEIYHSISGALVRVSYTKGFEIKGWAAKEEKYFYNFELIRSLDDLKIWSKTVVTQFIDFFIKQENNQPNFLVEQTKKYIQENIFKEISLTEIASYIFVHPNYLSRLFSEETGMSIMDYVITLRMSKARELLIEQNLKIYEVCEMVGYNSVTHFSRIFKREVGMSPKEYKSRNG